MICGGSCADIVDCTPSDPRALLDRIAVGLAYEFDGTVAPDIVRLIVLASYRRLVADAGIVHYLPVLAARRARGQLANYRDQATGR